MPVTGPFPVPSKTLAQAKTEILAGLALENVTNTSDANKPISILTQTALNLKANLASPIFTGTVQGITKSMVGLSNVDNTTDANKPISTLTQTALNLKANLATSIQSNVALANGAGTGSEAIANMVAITEAAYNALAVKHATTVYLIIEP